MEELTRYLKCDESEVLKTVQDMDGGPKAKEEFERMKMEQDKLFREKQELGREVCRLKASNAAMNGKMMEGWL